MSHRSWIRTPARPRYAARYLAAAILVAIGLIALAPAAAPLLTRFGDGSLQALAVARPNHRGASAADGSPGAAAELQDRSLRQVCGNDLNAFRLDGLPMCTHGDDVTPAGYDRTTRVQPVKATTRSAQTISCIGDGKSGPRIQVLYVYAGTSNFDAYLDSLRTWVADMESIFDQSAMQTGGRRELRIVTDQDCYPSIIPVQIGEDAIASFDGSIRAVIDALNLLPDPAQRYTSNRNYLMFADTQVFCGIGTIRSDTRPTSDNINNIGGSFARADNGCWSGMVAAHEVTHNLGGVQLSAPNSSGGWHCVDERDVMCYSDTPYRPTMINRCTTGVWATGHFLDCNHDDYFNTNPSVCNYLSLNWNTANSAFLFDPTGGNPAPDRVPCISIPATSGAVGSTLRISAADFASGQPISLALGGVVIGHATASTTGAATVDVSIPAVARGERIITAASATATAQAYFTVTPSMSAASRPMATGKRARVRVFGFYGGESVQLKLGPTVVGRAVADASGVAAFRFTVADDAPLGLRTLTAAGVRGSRATDQVTIADSGAKRKPGKR